MTVNTESTIHRHEHSLNFIKFERLCHSSLLKFGVYEVDHGEWAHAASCLALIITFCCWCASYY